MWRDKDQGQRQSTDNSHKRINVGFPLKERCADLDHGERDRGMSDTLILAETVQPSFLINTTEDSTIFRKVRNQPPCWDGTHKGDEPFKNKTIEKNERDAKMNIEHGGRVWNGVLHPRPAFLASSPGHVSNSKCKHA